MSRVTLLNPTDRRRVEIYFTLVERLREIEEAFTEWQDAGKHPDITPEQRAEGERAIAEAMGRLSFEDVQKKLPTPAMLHAFALEQIAADIAELKSAVQEVKEAVGAL